MQRVKELIKDKRVAIIGNAETIFFSENKIDSYDVIIRINLGHPTDSLKSYLGTRTDVWITCGSFQKRHSMVEFYNKFNPKFTVVMDVVQPLDEFENIIRYPTEWKDKLTDTVYNNNNGQHASTGLNAINLCMVLGGYKDITIYGFDFMRTVDWTFPRAWGLRVDSAHDFWKEEKYIVDLIESNNKIRIKLGGEIMGTPKKAKNKAILETISEKTMKKVKCVCGHETIETKRPAKCWKCQRTIV